jgi:predicted deacylase
VISSETLDAELEIELHRVTSPTDGPVVAILGGVHGDELEGVIASSIVLDTLGDLRSGEVRVVPRSNPSALAARSRESASDGNNLARCFPRHPSGTETDRTAHILTERVIRGAGALIDLHAGGHNYAMPFFAGYAAGAGTGERAAAMARAFAAPITWRHDVLNSGRSLSTAVDLGVPAIYAEGGNGGGSLGHAEIGSYVGGVRRVLASMGMLDPADVDEGPSVRHVINGGDGNTDASLEASQSGYFLAAVAPGEPVTQGTLIGEIRDAAGRRVERIESPMAGRVMMIRTVARVSAGDGIVMLSPGFEPDDR